MSPWKRPRRVRLRRLALLVSALASAQFLLSGLDRALPGRVMVYLWILAAMAVTWGTFIGERLKAPRGGWMG